MRKENKQTTQAVFAIDTETYYDRDYSVSSGIHAYMHSHLFDCYMVAVCRINSDGSVTRVYSGEPALFNWNSIPSGSKLVAHNVSFDVNVIRRLEELNIVPSGFCNALEWADTSDLAAYLNAPRNLKDAARVLLGIKDVDKATRELMSGVTWEEAKKRGWEQRLKDYCIADAEICARIWAECSSLWPEHEQAVSELNRRMGEKGIRIDEAALQEGKNKVLRAINEAQECIPWADCDKLESRKAFFAQCDAEGLPRPKSLDKKDPETQSWIQQYSAEHPWIEASINYKSARGLLGKLITLEERIRPDGTADVNRLLYCGAGTGRFSGSSGFNCQNLPREEQYGVNLRNLFVPAPGNKFIICDLSQIEARVLLHLAGDTEQLKRIKAGENLYEVHARTTMGYTGSQKLSETDRKLYALSKARVLGLGYGCSGPRFKDLAASLAGVQLTEDEAIRQVMAFRESNPLIIRLWQALDQRLKMHSQRDFDLKLPSGRRLTYRGVHTEYGDWYATVQSRRSKLYGGKLCENLVQATARDIFVEMMLAIDKAGYDIRLHVHDEIVVEVPEAQAEQAAQHIKELMSQAPSWASNLPLAAEETISAHYCK